MTELKNNIRTIETTNEDYKAVIAAIDNRLRRLIDYDQSVIETWNEDPVSFTKSLYLSCMQDLVQEYTKIKHLLRDSEFTRPQLIALQHMTNNRNSKLFRFERYIEELPKEVGSLQFYISNVKRIIIDVVKEELPPGLHYLVRANPKAVDRFIDPNTMSEADIESELNQLRKNIDDVKYSFLEATILPKTVQAFRDRVDASKVKGNRLEADFTLGELKEISPEIHEVARFDILNRFFVDVLNKDFLFAANGTDYHCEEMISWGGKGMPRKVVFVEGATDYFKLKMLDGKDETKEFMKSKEYVEQLRKQMLEREMSDEERVSMLKTFLTSQASTMISKNLGLPVTVKTLGDLSNLFQGSEGTDTVQRMLNKIDGEWSVSNIKIDVTRHILRLIPGIENHTDVEEFTISFSGKVYNRVGVAS